MGWAGCSRDPASAGGLAGVSAAVATCLHPNVVERTFGADDDAWILILSFLALLLSARAVDVQRLHVRVGLGTGAGLALGVLAASWGGWPFPLALLAATVLAMALPFLPRVLGWTCVRPLSLRTLAWAFVPLLVALEIMIRLFHVEVDVGGVTGMIAGVLGVSLPTQPVAAPPADTFATVAELHALTVAEALGKAGWPGLVLAALGVARVSQRLRQQTRGGEAAAMVLLALLTWLFAALMLTETGERFVLLLVPPVAVLAGAGLACLVELAGKIRPRLAVAGAVLAVGVVSGLVTWRAVALVADNRPTIDSAWVLTLQALGKASPDDALVLAWWDVGHWITFWSGRSVAVDGASLRDPRVNAIGRLFAADADQPVAAQVRAAACVDDGRICPHGGIYIVLSSRLLSSDAWMISGMWQPYRAWLVDSFSNGADGATRLGLLRSRFAGGDAGFLTLAEAAAGERDRRARAMFSAPEARIWSTHWQPCNVMDDGSYTCALDLNSADGWRFDSFHIDPQHPDQGAFSIHRTGDASAQPVGLAPSAVRVATKDGLYRVVDAAAGDTNPGVLFDAEKGRVFVGTPAMLRSLVARLLLLGGRYDTQRFELVSSYATVDGNTVQAWRVIPQAAVSSP